MNFILSPHFFRPQTTRSFYPPHSKQITSLTSSRKQNPFAGSCFSFRPLVSLQMCLCPHPSISLQWRAQPFSYLPDFIPRLSPLSVPLRWFFLISIKPSSFLSHYKKKAFPQPHASGFVCKAVHSPQGNAQCSLFKK